MIRKHEIKKRLLLLVFLVAAALFFAGCEGLVEESEESGPKPICKDKDDGEMDCTMVPYARTVNITIDFLASPGRLASVTGIGFAKVKHAGVDTKNFKYNLFKVEIDGVAKGGESELVLRSEEFYSSTELFIYTRNEENPWVRWVDLPKAENRHYERPDGEVEPAAESAAPGGHGAPGHGGKKASMKVQKEIRDLAATVKDGGPLDFDGQINGKIEVVCGPRDSFWGYAIGTLFIRFFGIFIVLLFLMIGMILSGKFFAYLDARQEKGSRPPEPKPVKAAAGDMSPEEAAAVAAALELAAGGPTEEEAAAIAAALHMHLSALEAAEPLPIIAPLVNSWTLNGRDRIMGERYLTFNRNIR